MLKKVLALIESTEGLEVNFKVGKESELTIKGDFKTMAKLAAEMAQLDSEQSKLRCDIREQEQRLKDLERA